MGRYYNQVLALLFSLPYCVPGFHIKSLCFVVLSKHDTYLQHNTGIADGLSGLGAALAALAEQNIQMVYTTVHQVLAQGNFVLAVSEGTFGGAPTSYYDLWRVEDGKIAEHWDVMETIADKSTWQNQNGKF